MSSIDLRDKVAIVGVGDTNYKELYQTSKESPKNADHLAARAYREALVDAGLDKTSVDGLICSRVSGYREFATQIGLTHPRVINLYEPSGRMSALAIQTAALTIAAGLADTVACVYGNDGRSSHARYGGFAASSASIEDAGLGATDYTSNLDQLYGMTSPGAYTALMWQRYRHEYGAPDDALAPVAIGNHRHAMLNSKAVRQNPLSMEEYLSARYIAEPLRLYDYCLINDGAVALILTGAERAKQLRKAPVYIGATASSADMTAFQSLSLNYWRESGEDVASRLYAAADVDRKDIQCLGVYDCFTPHVLLALESFGFCDIGESWEWIRGGRCELGGQLPINTSGGHTAESYMQGWNLHAELVRQLRGECGDRQVKDCDVVQYITEGPIVSSHILHN